MTLLHEIQEAIIQPSSDLGPILLKLRLLASRLGSHQLEEWVKYESEGYPKGAEVPDYRQIELSYSCNCQNIAWQATNQPIPPALIKTFCGEDWLRTKIRESISAIEGLLRSAENGAQIGIDSSNLILSLQGKIYPDMNISSVKAQMSAIAIKEIQNTVRTRILELTMKLEQEVPESSTISIRTPIEVNARTTEKVEHVFHMTVLGNNTMITSTGANANIAVNNVQGDASGVKSELEKAGIPKDKAGEFAEIVASESNTSATTPLGKKAQDWLAEKVPEIASGAWNISLSVATSILEEVAKRYYGLS
ncbi:MAG: hypothetical protein HWE30_07040 [Methylocystaceae bacterium]|nr:hypothetical protein [Methylocystaceae bacterium]